MSGGLVASRHAYASQLDCWARCPSYDWLYSSQHLNKHVKVGHSLTDKQLQDKTSFILRSMSWTWMHGRRIEISLLTYLHKGIWHQRTSSWLQVFINKCMLNNNNNNNINIKSIYEPTIANHRCRGPSEKSSIICLKIVNKYTGKVGSKELWRTSQLKTASSHMMPPLLHVCNGLTRPADKFTLAQHNGL